MEKVRVGVIGLGNMGAIHAKYIDSGEVKNAELTAVCDISPIRLEWAKENLKENVKMFKDAETIIKSGLVDGLIIAVPHYEHPILSMKSFSQGLHVLLEKPAGVYTKQVREMNEAAEKCGLVFGIMYNQRTNPLYQKLRDIITSGDLGEIKRTNWIITNWYRPEIYFNSGSWRATWEGEGGGVLINQCPHNLDLWQWICGMPLRVRAFCGFGKYHDIEVEDDVTAYVEYENGATGVFITSTGEAPGTNRLEVIGDMGKIVSEDGKLTFWRNRQSERTFNSNAANPFSQPEVWKCEIPTTGVEKAHKGITENWVNAILNKTPLIAPGIEGINGLQISNAIQLSSWTDNWVSIPVDEDLYFEKLQEKIKKSKPKKIKTDSNKKDIKITF
jgi:predicted dehydrogenase